VRMGWGGHFANADERGVSVVLRLDKNAMVFTVASVGGKSAVAVSQIYAMFVFSMMHDSREAAVIYLLLGYAIWMQVLELGFSQAAQNRFNARISSLFEICFMVLIHYIMVIGLAVFVVASPIVPQLLLPADRYEIHGPEFKAFSVGMAVMIIASNNVITQRMLLVLNKGLVANGLLVIQSSLAIVGLAFYQRYGKASVMTSILLFLLPQVVTYLPLLVKIVGKVIVRYKQRLYSSIAIFKDAARYWLLNILSALFLGADYYFAAHYLSGEEIVSYHFATRFFFLSFVIYYAYVQYQARCLTLDSLEGNTIAIRKSLRDSMLIGLSATVMVYVSVIALDNWQFFEHIIGKSVVSYNLMLGAFAYFAIRVIRDVGVVVLANVGAKSSLCKVYAIEIVLGFALLSVAVKPFAAMGIFLSMAGTCVVSSWVIYYVLKKSIAVQPLPCKA